mgnify:CR=1 FL=1
MPDNRKGVASALHIRGLRQRWMFSAVLPILLLLVLAVFLVFRPFVNRAADNKRG